MARAGKLRPVAITANKQYSGTDLRLVPADGATTDIYRQGATCAESKSIPTTNTTLAVYDTNALQIGETVKLGTDATKLFTIVAMASRTSITIKSATAGTIAVVLGDRLVPTTKPTVFDSVTGEVVKAVFTADSQGFIQFSTYEQAVDYIVSGAGITTRLFIDHRAGAVTNYFNVLDYGAVGDGVTDDEPALNRLFDYVARLGAAGGLATVFFPRGVYSVKDTLIWSGENLGSTPCENLHILGENGATIKLDTAGWGSSLRLTWIGRPTVSHANITIENIIFDGSSYGGGGGEAALITALETNQVSRLKILRCVFKNIGNTGAGIVLANDGIRLGGDGGTGTPRLTEDFEIAGCKFLTCERNGISGISTKDGFVHHCYFEGFENAAIDFEPNTVSEYCHNIRFEALTIKNARTLAIFLGPGAGSAGTITELIADCVIDNVLVDIPSGTSARGIIFHNMLRSKILEATINGNSAGGADCLALRSCRDCTIEGAVITSPVNSNAAIIVDNGATLTGSGNKVRGSTIRDPSRHGINVSTEDDLLLEGNTIIVTASSSFRAIFLATAPRARVLGNGINGPWLVGISVSNAACTDCILVGNSSDGASNSEINDVGTRTILLGNKSTGTDAMTVSGAHVTTALFGGLIAGAATTKRWTGEITVAANAGPGTVSTATDYTNTSTNANIIVNPKNQPAARMMAGVQGSGGTAGRAPFPTRTASGFDLTHEGNPDAGTAATFGYTIFQ